jgi:hypothetical protein
MPEAGQENKKIRLELAVSLKEKKITVSFPAKKEDLANRYITWLERNGNHNEKPEVNGRHVSFPIPAGLKEIEASQSLMIIFVFDSDPVARRWKEQHLLWTRVNHHDTLLCLPRFMKVEQLKAKLEKVPESDRSRSTYQSNPLGRLVTKLGGYKEPYHKRSKSAA